MTDQEARQRYSDAMERRLVLLAAWEEAGRPVLALGGHRGDVPRPHPLIEQLHRVDVLCDQLGRTVRGRGVGRPVGSASAPDRREPPRLTLRAVGRADGA